MKSRQYLASEHFWAKKLPTGWRYEFFNDLISDTIDNRGRTVPTSDYGIPLIATNCISNDSLYPKFKDVRYVSQKTHDEWFRDGHPEPNDIIFVNKGSPGQVCLVPSPLNFCFAQDMIGLKIDYKKVDFRYLLAILRTKFMQEQIFAFHVGTLIPHLKKADLNSIIIPIPPKKLEEFIGEYYLTVSSKIENLQKQNQILEQITQTIFKSWFVDFDGVTEFEDSELGKIPKGWKVEKFSEVVEVLSGGTPKTNNPEYWDGDIKWVSIVDTKQTPFVINTEKTITGLGVLKSSAKILPAYTIVITARGTVGNCTMLSESMAINQSCYGLEGKTEIGVFFLFHLLKYNLPNFLGNVHGSVFDTITRSTFDTVDVIMPPKELSKEFDHFAKPFFDTILKDQMAIDILNKIRDSLLPKLMSGEIQV